VIGQKKVEVKYVVAKRANRGAVGASGAKGPYKVVDKRLKKDKRAAKQRGKANKKKQSNGKGNRQSKGKGNKQSSGPGNKQSGGKGNKQQRPSKNNNRKK
jgi:hypothetical protein